MVYGSVCSGIEAASVAWKPLGWKCAFVSEIEPFPCAVLAHHYPGVPNLGDMTKFQEWPDAKLDVLVGGTPCQSFSVAGLRKGLADPRGNLALTFLAIADRYRPRWVVWENVPGVLSSAEGRDFGAFLGALGQLGYGWAYRVLDAQYFGVPQRRRRVFVVGHLGDWRRAAAVLLERSSLRGDPAPRREAGERPASTLRSGPSGGRSHGKLNGSDRVDLIAAPVASCLETTCNDYSRADGFNMVAFDCKRNAADSAVENISPTLRAMSFDSSHANGGGQVAVAFEPRVASGRRSGVIGDTVGALTKEADRGDGHPCVAFQAKHYTRGGTGGAADSVVNALTNATNPGSDIEPLLASSMQVRRLTPRECERLQEFPDDYTLITFRGKPAADGPRYKALGNSMHTGTVRWIGERIDLVEQVLAELEAAA